MSEWFWLGSEDCSMFVDDEQIGYQVWTGLDLLVIAFGTKLVSEIATDDICEKCSIITFWETLS